MTIENIILFEDDITEQFLPLVYNRSTFELTVGMFSFLERAHLFFPDAKYNLFTREYLKPILSLRYPKYFINNQNVGIRALLVNGRAVLTKELVNCINPEDEKNVLVTSGENFVMAYLSGELLLEVMKQAQQEQFNGTKLIRFLKKRPDLSIVSHETVLFENLWTMISRNGEMIRHDFNLVNKGGVILSKVGIQVALTNEENIHIGKNSKISPFVHIDASHGPVYIGEKVIIKSGVLIEGPACIDDDCQIFPGYIKKNTTLRENGRYGGEISGSIFLSHSNKQHTGFIGDSYVGEWVNLGAMTTTSNLKNNYSNIKLSIGSKSMETGLQFLGSIIADHAKLGIGTLLGAGTVIGLGSNVVGGNVILPKWIPSFTWITGKGIARYEIEKFINMVMIVYKRRGKVFGLPERSLTEYLYQLASKEYKS